ncbi:MAG: hypothetical protein HXY44_14865 [Syntrophaceae bacterium]|nr:hypothetical protein [Syntrophaceae bacterium]
MRTQILVIVLSLMLSISVSYGQGTKSLVQSKPVRFTQGGYQYTVQSTLSDGKLETVVRYTPTAGRSSSKPGEVRVALGRRNASISSRVGDGSTITLTQAGSRLTAVYSHGDKKVRKEGNEAEVMRFIDDQYIANATGRPKTDSPFVGKFTAKDPALMGKMKKSFLQTVEEVKQRHEARLERMLEDMRRWCKENPEWEGCPKFSFCQRADQGCSGGSTVSCAFAAGCDFFEWLFDFTY